MYMRRHLCLLGSLVFAGFVTLGACGDDSSSGTGGKGGGTAATGGNKGGTGGVAGAAGGRGGATGGRSGAGGVSGCTNIPSCLQFLLNCAPAGTCMSQTTITLSPPSGTFSKCYGNGVKQATTAPLSGSTATGTTIVSLNGTFCYAYDIPLGAGGTSGGSSSLVFKNASGGVLATVVSANATTTTLSCGGQTYQVASSCTSAVASAGTSTTCTAGTCP